MPTRKVQSISVKELSASIDRAVTLASKRRGLKTDGPNLALGWEIYGRILREAVDLNVAFETAAEITKGVNARGLQAEPTVSRFDRSILIGFIERVGVTKLLGR
jgi:hypothetical protein